MQYKIDESIAQADVDAFLDSKKMKPSRREQLKPAIEVVVEAVRLGDVAFLPDEGKITQTLCFPIETATPVTALVFNTRTKIEVLNSRYKKTDGTAQAKIDTVIECVCGLLPALVNRLEPTDKNVSDSIALFFM